MRVLLYKIASDELRGYVGFFSCFNIKNMHQFDVANAIVRPRVLLYIKTKFSIIFSKNDEHETSSIMKGS